MRRLVLAALAIIGAAFVCSQSLAAPVQISSPLTPGGSVKVENATTEAGMVVIKPNWFTWRFIYGADGIAAGYAGSNFLAKTCDSTYILENTLGYNRLALALTVAFEDSVGAGLFAVQWRGAATSSSSDSANTFTLLSDNTYVQRPQTVDGVLAMNTNTNLHSASSAASLGKYAVPAVGWLVTGAGIPAGTVVTAKVAGDSAVTISQACSTPINGSVQFWNPASPFAPSDTIGTLRGAMPAALFSPGVPAWGASQSDTSTLYPGERAMVLSRTGNGSGVLVPIKMSDGSWFSPPYIGLRIRIMNTYWQGDGRGVGGSGPTMIAIGNANKTYGQAMTFTGAGVCETCQGAGVNSPNVGKYIQIRADLVGWRE